MPLNTLLDIIFPMNIECMCCSSITSKSEYGICKKCTTKLTFTFTNVCPKCGRLFSFKNDADAVCDDCRRNDYSFEQAISCLDYNTLSSKIITDFKDRNRFNNAENIVKMMVKRLKTTTILENIDYITFVPIHSSKLRKRGFNQSQVLSKMLSKEIGIEVIDDLIIKTNKTDDNKFKNEHQRFETLRKSFAVGNHADAYLGKSFLLVDDVFTTGATTNIISSLLKKNGINKVYVLTFLSNRKKIKV